MTPKEQLLHDLLTYDDGFQDLQVAGQGTEDNPHRPWFVIDLSMVVTEEQAGLIREIWSGA